MKSSEDSLYRETERQIHRSTQLLVVLALVVVGLVWGLWFLRESVLHFDEEKGRINDDYVAQQESILRARVDSVSELIVTYRAQAEERLRRAVRERVDGAYAVAAALIADNEGRLDEAELQRLVVDALRPLRWRDGSSYLWITSYDLEAVLFPTEPELEGRSLADSAAVRQQAETARTSGAGFNEDRFHRPGHPATEEVAQISYVRDLGRWGWYVGSAEFLEDFERDLQTELLGVIAQFRYGDNYIFIDTFDGYALLMNGELLDPPQYAWELEDANGLKILQEQLRVAQASPEGGFLSYTWNEASLGQPVEYLSFVRTIDDWGWKIGTGTYVEQMDDEIASRQATLWGRTWTKVLVGSGVGVGVLLAVLLAAVILNRRMVGVLSELRANLESSREGLVALNATLEERVREETERRVTLHQLANTDPLTGLANRRQFEDVLAAEWSRAVRLERPMSLILADIDRFKAYNDTHGHQAGDLALRKVGDALRGALRRGGDAAARYGGEEFVVVLPETHLEGAYQVAKRIHREIAELGLEHGADEAGATLSMSLGVASLVPEPGQEAVMLVGAADRALYAAKRNGRDRVEVVDLSAAAPE